MKGDGFVANEDRVVGTQLVVGHDLGTGREDGAGRDVVEPSDQGGDPGEPGIRWPVGAVVVGHLAFDERQDFAPPLVDPEQPRRSVEANLSEVAQ